MGQKINPISLRLQSRNRDFDNCWYSDYFYARLLSKDLYLQQYFNTFLKLLKLPASRFSIQYLPKKIRFYTFLCYPKSSRFSRSKIFGVVSGLKKRSKKYALSSKGGTRFSKTRQTKFFRSAQNRYKSVLKLRNTQSLSIQKKYNFWGHQQSFLKLFSAKNQNIPQRFGCFDRYDPKFSFIRSLVVLYSVFHWKKNVQQKQGFFVRTHINRLEKMLMQKQLSSFFPKGTGTKGEAIVSKTDVLAQKSSTFGKTLFSMTNGGHKSDLSQRFGAVWNRRDEKYKSSIQRYLSGMFNIELSSIPFKITQDWQNAGYLADEIVYFLEKRVPFRRIKSKISQHLSQNPKIRGLRITCSGRVGGKSKKAQRAKTECVKYGQTSLHVFSSQIDFASRTAATVFGSVGVKVWISYN